MPATATRSEESPLSAQERGLGGEAREEFPPIALDLARLFKDLCPKAAGTLDELIEAGQTAPALIARLEGKANPGNALITGCACAYVTARAAGVI